MLSSKQAAGRELKTAFAAFNLSSAALGDAFDALRQQVAVLTGELEEARASKAHMAQHLAQVIEGLPGGVLVLRSDHAIAETNSTARALLPAALPGADFEIVLAEARIGTGEWLGDVELRGGRWVRLARRSSPAGEVVLLTDVTEAHLLQTYLARQQRLLTLGELAAGLAHQIRTPLAAALLYASQLEMPGLPARDYAGCAAKTCERLRELEKLIHDMLEFTRGAASVDVVSVSAVLEQVAQWLRPALGAGTRLSIHTDAPGLKIRANAPSLVSALLNLATNAMQAAAGDLRIDMRARRSNPGPDGARAEITVSDDGPGIAPEARERIFEPFYTTRAQGNGLGLSIVKSVVEAHGGSIRLAPTSQHGATFIVELPAAE